MNETLLEKANRLGIKPAGTSSSETLLQKAQRLGIKPPEPEKGYFSRVGEQYSKAGKDIITATKQGGEKAFEQSNKGDVLGATGSYLRTGLRTAGAVAGAAFAPILEAPGIKQATEYLVGKAVNAPGIKDVITSAVELANKYPNQAKDIQNIIDIAALGYAPKASNAISKEVKAISSDARNGVGIILTPTEQQVQNKVLDLFQKSIKPTAKKSLGEADKYDNSVINALKTIKNNSSQLNIEDAAGEIITGRTPQTINELAQGLDQTKKIVFNQYDSLAKKAGTQGAIIDAKPIASEVELVAMNKALQITNPEVVKYAESWAKRLKGLDTLDTETTQAVIQNLNNSLTAFYRNPTYEAASKVSIDAGIANNFRKALDKAIEGATGEQYQVLKNQYAALKAIENDLVRASMRDARKNTKGLLDYSDIFTGGQMVGGILSLNPAMFTKGAVERGFKEYIKYLNDPNRAISNIFEKLNVKQGETFTPTSASGQFLQRFQSTNSATKNPTKSNTSIPPIIPQTKK